MDGPDPQELRAHYQSLTDEALAELHIAGPDEYVPTAWALLDEEFRARGASVKAAEEQLLAERPPNIPSGPPYEVQAGADELVTIFASSDLAELAVAKLVLESEGLPFITKGEGVQDLFGWGRLGGMNLITGPVQLQVRRQDADLARELLEELRDGPREPRSTPE